MDKHASPRIIEKIRNGWIVFLPLIPLLILLSSGLQGIDFGFHWDEDKTILLVKRTVESGLFLPRWYRYPSFPYWLSLSALLPHLRAALQQAGTDGHELVAHLLLVVDTPAFLLQVRKIFLAVSSLAVLWTFAAVEVQRRRWAEALLGACLLGLSWEVAYHARWVAPDALLMQFGALVLMLLVLALEHENRKGWILGAAAAAGLACSAKYPGGLLLVPVLLGAFFFPRRQKTAQRIGRVLQVCLLFGGVYLLVTPGTLLDPVTFYKDIAYELRHYAGSYESQVVAPGLPHLGLMLLYFSSAAFSHYAPVSWAIFALVILGIAGLIHDQPLKSLVLFSFPLVYLLYFSTQSVMIVRNLLVVLPFLALAGARGGGMVWDSLKPGWLRGVWCAILGMLMIANAYWLYDSAQSIRMRGTGVHLLAFLSEVNDHPERTYYVSARVESELRSAGMGSSLPNLLPAPADQLPDGFCADPDARAVLYAKERKSMLVKWGKGDIREFLPRVGTEIIGTWEVNFLYYPLWAGEDRLLVLHADKACRLGALP